METIENWLSGNLYVQWGSLYERTVRGPGHSQLIKINGHHCHIRFNLSLILNQSWLNFTACRYIKSCVLFAVSIFCYRNIFLCIWEILSEVIRVGYDSIIKCLQKSPVSPGDEPTMTNKSIQYILLFLRWSVNKHHSNFYWILVADSDKFLAFPAANQIRRYFYFGRISGWGIFKKIILITIKQLIASFYETKTHRRNLIYVRVLFWQTCRHTWSIFYLYYILQGFL